MKVSLRKIRAGLAESRILKELAKSLSTTASPADFKEVLVQGMRQLFELPEYAASGASLPANIETAMRQLRTMANKYPTLGKKLDMMLQKYIKTKQLERELREGPEEAEPAEPAESPRERPAESPRERPAESPRERSPSGLP